MEANNTLTVVSQSALGQAPEASKSEDAAAAAIFLELILLATAFILGRALEKARFPWMGEAGAALLLGLVVSVLLRVIGIAHKLADAVTFKGDIFFYVLLPTIMFDAGYGLDTRMFVRNVGSVCTFAFAGTTISCFVIGLMMWAFGLWGWCYPMSLLENLTFGALISATDPVTVLAVFSRLRAQPDLYMNVFGESVLNDAVGMVLYNVISAFLGGKAVTAGSVFAGIGIFIAIFIGSALVGVVVGLLAALIFRSQFFYSQGADGHGSSFEVGLAVVFAYSSYLAADLMRCSGIVAVMVNGMVMHMYVQPNLSPEAAHKIENLFKVLASLFELFVFIYIGTTLFLVEEKFNIARYMVLSLLALAVSRALNVWPCTLAINWLRPAERQIPQKQQFMLWWSGLRGAMAFALSVQASEQYGEAGKVMKTCTFYLIFITVLFNGGTSGYLLQRLRLRAEDTPALLLAPAGSALELESLTPPKGDGDGDERADGVAAGDAAEASSPLYGLPRPRSKMSRLGSAASFVERVRSMNDGRLVAKFDEFDKAMGKMLIRPDALRDKGSGQALQLPSHSTPQSLEGGSLMSSFSSKAGAPVWHAGGPAPASRDTWQEPSLTGGIAPSATYARTSQPAQQSLEAAENGRHYDAGPSLLGSVVATARVPLMGDGGPLLQPTGAAPAVHSERSLDELLGAALLKPDPGTPQL